MDFAFVIQIKSRIMLRFRYELFFFDYDTGSTLVAQQAVS